MFLYVLLTFSIVVCSSLKAMDDNPGKIHDLEVRREEAIESFDLKNRQPGFKDKKLQKVVKTQEEASTSCGDVLWGFVTATLFYENKKTR